MKPNEKKKKNPDFVNWKKHVTDQYWKKKYIALENYKEIFKKGKYGFEKEALRVNEYGISKHDHPKSIGSKLCNKFITTDFCETQLELITPPLESKKESITFLDDIGHFVSRNISDELMWPH